MIIIQVITVTATEQSWEGWKKGRAVLLAAPTRKPGH